MKKIMLTLLLGLLLAHCNSKPIAKPDNLISEDQMVDILYDLYLINAIKSNNGSYLKEQELTPAEYIYQKYKIDSLQFSKSDKYYAADLDDYQKLYERVTTRLQRNKAEVDSLIAKNPAEKVADSIAKKPQVTPSKLRDSLRNKRQLRNRLFNNKETIKN